MYWGLEMPNQLYQPRSAGSTTKSGVSSLMPVEVFVTTIFAVPVSEMLTVVFSHPPVIVPFPRYRLS